MDSHRPVLSATGGLPSACDRVNSGAVLHRAVEGGLEECRGTEEVGKADEETVGAVAASQGRGQTRSITRSTIWRKTSSRLGLMHRQKRMVKNDDGLKRQSYANDKENGAGYKAEPFFKFGNASE